jgi:hypothetical protein
MIQQILKEKRKEVLIAVSSVLSGIVLLIVYFSAKPDASAYSSTQDAVLAWQESPKDESLLQSMKKRASKTPSLLSKFEPQIAKNLLLINEKQQGKILANKAIERLREDLPFHALYAECTYLIEAQEYQNALEKAVVLKDQLEDQSNAVLEALNLFRIAILQNQLKNGPGELFAWNEVENILQKKPELKLELQNGLFDGKVDLSVFIKERIKSLDE